MPLIATLAQSALLRRIVRSLRLHKLGNRWLQTFPMVRRLSGSGVTWRATRLESIPLAHEMLGRGDLYDATLLPRNFQTFADLGCNVGYFTCWLAHLAQGRKLKGLMLDANPQAVAEARWHATANSMTDVFALNGVLGENSLGGFSDFYLYESNICSNSQLPDIEKLGLRGDWTKISVPIIDLEKEWQKRFGNERCHLLKIDIEGSETGFLVAEPLFLSRTDAVLIEWHKWRVQLPVVRDLLQAQGLKFVKILDEQSQMGTAFFSRLYDAGEAP
ncbi:MAG: FkbM family methyltransferase [Verrucomicrobia bacterium]|nr:MAG: FkbM family methyltransferase [Verrucomicrobiota bacterium]